MNMNKALQNLYHAVSGQTTTKRNISKLLLDIHYAITGKQSANKNNWSRIIDSMATNWSGGGGGGDFSTCTVTLSATEGEVKVFLPMADDGMALFGIPASSKAFILVNAEDEPFDAKVILYKGRAEGYVDGNHSVTVTGGVLWTGSGFVITGDGTITIS